MGTIGLLLSHELISLLVLVLSVILVGSVLHQRRPTGSAFAWVLGIVLLPYVAIPLFLMFGGRKFRQRWSSKRPLSQRSYKVMPRGFVPEVPDATELTWLESGEAAYAEFLRAIRGARRVIAISDATRSAIERVYPEHASKVRVVRHGVDRERFDPSRALGREALNDIVPPGTSYSLCVGQGSPYKNHPRILRAFVRAMGDRTDHKLVLVRRFSRVDGEMNRLLQDPAVRRLVVEVPHVSDEKLLTLYRHARMLLFASLYEGFGMPALEAMSFGLPVVASSAEAVAEVTGDGALHPDPRDEEAIAHAIVELDRDEGLRERLIARGRARAAEFSWRRCAEETLAVYREAMDAKEP